MPTDHPRSYAKALRYAADEDTVALGLKSLTPEDRHPADHLTENRARMSDAMREAGRDGEADLLADPANHVVVHEGRVVPGEFRAFGPGTAGNRWNALWDHLPVHVLPDFDVDEKGGMYGPEHFAEPSGPLPRHHVRVVHFYDNDDQPLVAHDIHWSDLPGHMADLADENVTRSGVYDEPDDAIDDDHAVETDRLIHEIRTAPRRIPQEDATCRLRDPSPPNSTPVSTPRRSGTRTTPTPTPSPASSAA